MTTDTCVFVFPGQGAHYQGILKGLAASQPSVRALIRTIDEAVVPLAPTLTEALLGEAPWSTERLLEEAPETLQLALYAAALASATVLESKGIRPDVLVGHSFGEIAALTFAGSFSVADGARLVMQRCAVLRSLGSDAGRMVALSTGRDHALALALLAGSDAALAVVNHDRQTVVSGKCETMDRLEALAEAAGIARVRLLSPYPFHCPAILGSVAGAFAEAARGVMARAPNKRVLSPILGREYRADDDLLTCLARHLLEPVDFAHAIETLAAEGKTRFVECGGRDALTRVVRALLPHADVRPTLVPGVDELTSITSAIADKAPSASAFERFWAENQAQVYEATRQAFERWNERSAPLAPRVAPNIAPNIAPNAAPKQTLVSLEARSTAQAPLPATSDTLPLPASAKIAAAALSTTRDAMFKELAAAFAEALEYPLDVFTETVDLEAELGIDSVKLVEFWARMGKRYSLPQLDGQFQLTQYRTMGQLTDVIWSVTQRTVAAA